MEKKIKRGKFFTCTVLYDILSSVLCIYQASWCLYSSLWYYFMIFFPQLSFIYNLSGKSLTRFIIMILLYDIFFLRSLYLSGKLVTVFIIMALLSLWYYFLSFLYLSGVGDSVHTSCMIFFPQFSVFIRQVGDSADHYGIISFVIFFPQFSVFVRQVGDSTHQYGITYFMIFFPQLNVFIRQFGYSVHHYIITYLLIFFPQSGSKLEGDWGEILTLMK